MTLSSSLEPAAPFKYGKFFWKPNAGATYLKNIDKQGRVSQTGIGKGGCVCA